MKSKNLKGMFSMCSHEVCNCLCVPFVCLTVVSGIATAEWKLSAHSNCAYITNILLQNDVEKGILKRGTLFLEIYYSF